MQAHWWKLRNRQWRCIDVADLKLHGFGPPQSGCIEQYQKSAVNELELEASEHYLMVRSISPLPDWLTAVLSIACALEPVQLMPRDPKAQGALHSEIMVAQTEWVWRTASAPRACTMAICRVVSADGLPIRTGDNEQDLLPLGRELLPGAALFSPRGCVLVAGARFEPSCRCARIGREPIEVVWKPCFAGSDISINERQR